MADEATPKTIPVALSTDNFQIFRDFLDGRKDDHHYGDVEIGPDNVLDLLAHVLRGMPDSEGAVILTSPEMVAMGLSDGQKMTPQLARRLVDEQSTKFAGQIR